MTTVETHIRNPHTNRLLKIGGRLYKKYEREGQIVNGRFIVPDKVVHKKKLLDVKEPEPKRPEEQKDPKKLEKQEDVSKGDSIPMGSEKEEKKDITDDELRDQLLSSFRNIMDDMEMKYDEEELLKKFDKEYEKL